MGIVNADPAWEAIAFDLPGCIVNATSLSELLEIAPIVVAEHVAWLRSSKIDVAADDGIEIQIAEEIRAAEQDAADGEFCFTDDLTPVSDADMTVGLAILESSRRDLLGAVKDVPDAILDWRPPLSAMARVDEWNPDARTIREITREIASAEGYYRTALTDGLDVGEAAGDVDDLAAHRASLIATLQSLGADDRGRLFKPQRVWQDRPEDWTVRKVIRRVISHERFHTAEIRQRISWLLVGVPRFR